MAAPLASVPWFFSEEYEEHFPSKSSLDDKETRRQGDRDRGTPTDPTCSCIMV